MSYDRSSNQTDKLTELTTLHILAYVKLLVNKRVVANEIRVGDLKKIKKIRLRSKLSLGLIYDLNFRIQAASYFPELSSKNRFNILLLFSTKTNR